MTTKSVLKKSVQYLFGLAVVLFALIALFPEKTTEIVIGLERSASGLEHRTVTVDGDTWHYLEGGPRDSEVLLMLHGFGGDKDNWTRFARSLTEHYRVIAPDLPGFGESSWHSDRNYSLFPQRDRLAKFVHALKLDQFHVIGNSMGGHLSALYAHEYSDKVFSLGLIDNAGVDSPVKSEHQQAVARGENQLIATSVEDFDRLIEFVTYERPFAPWPVLGVFAKRAMDRAERNASIYASGKSDHAARLEPLLAEINNPVLIMWGEFDRVIDVSSVDVMRPLMPQAEVIILEDTGHIPILERPAETAMHYLEFLAKTVDNRNQ